MYNKPLSNTIAVLFGILGGLNTAISSYLQPILMAMICGAAGYIGKQIVVLIARFIMFLLKQNIEAPKN